MSVASHKAGVELLFRLQNVIGQLLANSFGLIPSTDGLTNKMDDPVETVRCLEIELTALLTADLPDDRRSVLTDAIESAKLATKACAENPNDTRTTEAIRDAARSLIASQMVWPEFRALDHSAGCSCCLQS